MLWMLSWDFKVMHQLYGCRRWPFYKDTDGLLNLTVLKITKIPWGYSRYCTRNRWVWHAYLSVICIYKYVSCSAAWSLWKSLWKSSQCCYFSIMVFQIIDKSTVCTTDCWGWQGRYQHQSFALLLIVMGIHQSPADFPHKMPMMLEVFHTMMSSYLPCLNTWSLQK